MIEPLLDARDLSKRYGSATVVALLRPAEQRIPQLLEFAALPYKADAKPGELSGGMRIWRSRGAGLRRESDYATAAFAGRW